MFKPSTIAASGTPFADIDQKYGLPPGLLASVWAQESSCGRDMLSRAGAKGHFQFMEPARNEVLAATGLDAWSSDPRVAAECAAYYLSKQLKAFDGDMCKALAAYNAGGGKVSKAVACAGNDWLSTLKAETRNYVPGILGRIGLDQRISFTQRYLGGTATAEEIARERAARRDILSRDFHRSDKEIDNMSDAQLFGNDFLAMVVSLVKSLFEGSVALFTGESPSAPASTPPAPSKVAGAKLAGVGVVRT